MCIETPLSGSPARPKYSARPVPKTSRLLRTRNQDFRGNGNTAGVPYPERGRRAWLEKLAQSRYDRRTLGWKSWKR